MADPATQPVTAPPPPTSAVPGSTLPLFVPNPIEIHLKKIDADSEKPTREKKSMWDIISILFTVASGIAVFVFGTLINGKLEQKTKERQLHSENIRQMQTLLLDLENTATKRETADASALALAAYGRDAVPMLLHTLGENPSFGGEAAANALRAIEPDEATQICPGLVRILNNRSNLYSFVAHRRALQEMADWDCRTQVPDLIAYGKRLDAAINGSPGAEYAFTAIGGGQVSPENITTVKTQLTKTLELLREGKP